MMTVRDCNHRPAELTMQGVGLRPSFWSRALSSSSALCDHFVAGLQDFLEQCGHRAAYFFVVALLVFHQSSP
jgi:hypothetical protein